MMKSKFNLILSLLTIMLLILSLAYLFKGFYTLGIDQNPVAARDLFERWKEQQYIYLGIYPYQMTAYEINPILGKINSGGYPPWAFFTGFLMFPNIPWPLTRFYHVFLNLISLLILSLFSYQIGLPFGRRIGYFFIVSCLAISSNGTTLSNGQYGLIINAFLIGIFWLINFNKNYLAGLLMGLSLAKPTISAPYFLILIITKNIKALLLASVYLFIASVSISHLTQLSLAELAMRFLRQIKYVADDGMSGINFLVNLGINTEIVTIFLSIVSIVIATVIFYFLRNFSLLTLFAIASVIGRVFTYHRFYDNVMLVFLLLALLQLAFSSPHWLNILMATLVGLTLWVPPLIVERMTNPYGNIVQIIIWLIALIYLVITALGKGGKLSRT